MARVVVTGGAGFLGSHLCEALVGRGDEVVAVDNLATSDGSNLVGLGERPGFSFVRSDISVELPVAGQVDAIAHLASPASPEDYRALPIETLAVGSRGTEACLRLAERTGARIVFASTSEVYGDPLEHPQRETYFGNVDPVGPRSVYDEAKRYAEALVTAYVRHRGIDAGIVRIFNTYGPRLRPGDGRVVSNFLVQAIRGEPLTVHGDGRQTRSFCYVDDLVRGLVSMIDAQGVLGPVNLGNPEEVTILALAELVLTMVDTGNEIIHLAPAPGDPTRRCPDIALALDLLDWQPKTALADGLTPTLQWFRSSLDRGG